MTTIKLKCECAEVLKECMTEQTGVMKRMASILEDVHSLLSEKSNVEWESSSGQDEPSHEEEDHDKPSDKERESTKQQTNVLSTDSVRKVHPEGFDPEMWGKFTEFYAYADAHSVSKAGMDESRTVTTTPKNQDISSLSILQSREDNVEDPVGEDVVVQEMLQSNPRIHETSSVETVSHAGVDRFLYKKFTEIAGAKSTISASKPGMKDRQKVTATLQPQHTSTPAKSTTSASKPGMKDRQKVTGTLQPQHTSTPGVHSVLWKKNTETAGTKGEKSPKSPTEQKRRKLERYEWALNPEGARYIQEQLEKMAFSKRQSVRDQIYEGGVQRKLWDASNEMEQSVNYKIEQIYKKYR